VGIRPSKKGTAKACGRATAGYRERVNRLLLRLFLFAIGFVVLFVIVSGPPGFDLGGLIGMLLVFGPWLIGGYLGWRWGRTWLRVAGVVTLGLFLTAGSRSRRVTGLSRSRSRNACGRAAAGYRSYS
jgi:hypothetical protein